MSDALIVGGGIIGLACAWELAHAGCRVALFDAAPEAREATWAAAGMLAPWHECEGDTPLLRLGVASLARWPRLLAEAGIAPAEVDLRLDGGWLPALDPAQVVQLERRRAALGLEAPLLSAAEAREREPRLAGVRAALLLPGGQVDPRLASAALRTRLAALGVELGYARAVARIAPGEVVFADGTVRRAAHVIIASGAWTPALAAAAGIDLPGDPVKGQLLRLDAPDGLLGRFVHAHGTYLVPRTGRGMVVGATMEEKGFDRRDDPAAIAALAAGARALLPALADAPIVETWTGLRPRLQVGRPVIAAVTSGLIVATGHFRNGILLAPATAAAVRALALGDPPPCDPAAFGLPCPTSWSSKTTPSTAS